MNPHIPYLTINGTVCINCGKNYEDTRGWTTYCIIPLAPMQDDYKSVPGLEDASLPEPCVCFGPRSRTCLAHEDDGKNNVPPPSVPRVVMRVPIFLPPKRLPFNGANNLSCDNYEGPCSCGAWHVDGDK